MSDIAREMLRMFGLGMGLDVASNQRLAKARELRERELDRSPELDRTPELERSPEAPSKPKLRVLYGSTPWIPPTARIHRK
jgi:hypothetical protein